MLPKRKTLLLIGILALAAYLRFFNLNWDQGHHFHPDERNLANAVSQVQLPTQLKPNFYAYNGFFIYLTDLTTQATSTLTQNPDWLTQWGSINLITRHFSAFFSLLTVFTLFLLARRLFSSPVSLAVSFWTATTVGFIQYAHYGVTESLLVFLLTLLFYLSYLLYQKPHSLKLWLLLSLIWGISLATKTTAAFFLIIPVVLLLQLLLKKESLSKLALHSTLFFFFGVLIALFFSPYSLLDFTQFKQSMLYEHNVVTGNWPVPYTTQFLNTTPYWFQLKNLPWQLGPVLAIIGPLTFLVWLAQSLIHPKRSPFLPALIFTLTYFLYIGRWHAKFIRYLLPLLPVFILSVGWLLDRLLKQNRKILSLVLFLLTSLSTLLWSTAYLNVFTQPQTRLQASRWLYQNVPNNSTLLVEEWDDHLPIPLPQHQLPYQKKILHVYAPDQQEKISTLSRKLSQGDYLIINSRRTYQAILNAPQKYPHTSRYYQLLFDQQLGYQPVATFSSFPRLGPLTIPDTAAEESFQVYDHPQVFIFKNTHSLPASQIHQTITNSLNP